MSGTINADSRSVKRRNRTCENSCHRASLKNANGPIKVLVSEPHQKTNIEKFAKDKGKKATSTEKGSEFEIVIE